MYPIHVHAKYGRKFWMKWPFIGAVSLFAGSAGFPIF